MIQTLPNITLFGTLSLLEFIWLLICIPGFFYSLANAIDSRKDGQALLLSGQATPKDWVICGQRTRHAVIGTCIELMFVVFGVASALTPNPALVSWLSYVISAVLIGGSGLLAWGAWRDVTDRRRIRMPDGGQD